MNRNQKHSKLSGKSFYIALCASVLAVGAIGVYSYHQTSDKLKHQLEELPEVTQLTTERWEYEDVTEKVDKPEDNIPKETEQQEITTAPVTEKPEVKDTGAKPSKVQPFVKPLNGEIIIPFSNGELVKSKTLNAWKTHDGVDIEGTIGDSVKSMTSGKIKDIREDVRWGVCVIIDHGNGIEGHYYNLNKNIPVKVGDDVRTGTIIGAIGDTAECEIAENSHLHFGVKKNGEWIDPMSIIPKDFN